MLLVSGMLILQALVSCNCVWCKMLVKYTSSIIETCSTDIAQVILDPLA